MDIRKHKRVLVQYPISFEGNQGPGKGTLFNLSLGGCAIEGAEPVRLGAKLTLHVHLPSQQPLQVEQAEVTWTAGKDFGVQFIRLAPHEQDRLEQLLVSLQQDSQQTGHA